MKNIAFVIGLLIARIVSASTLIAKPGDNLQNDLNASTMGTLTLAAGTFTFSAPITIPSGTAIIGASGLMSHVVYTGSSPSAAFIIPANASNVTIQGIDLVSSNGLVKMMDGAGYTNITITRCNLGYTSGGGAFGSQQVMGITDTVPVNNLQVTHNNFHDDTGPGRNWYIYRPANSNFDFNLFENINDGGQINLPQANVSVSYNYGTELRRMGQETASHDGAVLTVTGNVFYGWASTNLSSFGLSLCTTPRTNPGDTDVTGKTTLICTNNYIQMLGSSQGGNCIEFGAGTVNFSSNIVGANCTPNGQLVTMMANQTGSGNFTFGPNGAAVNGEGGPFGSGSWVGAPITNDSNVNHQPAPVPNTFAGPAFTSAPPSIPVIPPPVTPPVTPPPTTQPITVAAAATANTVAISWISQLTNAVVTFGTPAQPNNSTVTVPGTTGGAMFGGANAGWVYDYSVNAGTLSGSGTFQTTGASPAGTTIQPFTLLTSPATQPTPVPATQPEVTHTISVYSDGSVTTK